MAKIIRLTAKNGAIKEIPFVGKFKLDPQFVGAKVEVIDSITGAWLSAVKVRIRGKNVDLSYAEDAQPGEGKPLDAADSQSSSDVGSSDGSKSSGLDAGDKMDVGASAQQPSAALPAGGGGLGAAGISGTSIALGVVGLGALAGIVAASGGSDKATTPTPPPPPPPPPSTTPPPAPTGLDLASADDSGASSTDNLTSQTSALTITGQAEANARVELFDGTTSLGTTTANASGAFSLDVTLAAGARAITAKATDAAGNVSAASAALAVTVDATAPAAPTGLDLAAADDSGSSDSDNVTSQTSALTITGQAEANARVELFDGTTSLGTTTANASGAFSLDVTLAAGARSITAKATDAAGNVSAASAALAVTVDATAPAVPTGLDLTTADDSGSDNADNVTNQTSALTITGQADANARVELFDGTTSLGTTTASPSGAFIFRVPLAASGNAHSITAKATDAAGNVSAASTALAITVDATVPAAPTGLDLITADDTGASSTDNLTNKQNVTITGTAEAGATVELFDGTTSLGTTTANASGAFSRVVTLDAGARSITAKATDAAGNVGTASATPLAITVDVTAPAAPTGPDLIAAIELSAIASGTGGFVINGASRFDNSGISVSSAGDVNGDGLADLIVGAFRADPNGNQSAGASYVVFGKTNTTAVELSAIASGTGGFVINGASANDNSGYSVSSAGDVNGDGFDDLIVGAKYADPTATTTDAGASYVVYGGNFTGAVTQVGTAGNDTLSGTARNDVMFGGLGNDIITTNGGNDRIAGGPGADTFVISDVAGTIRILDFGKGDTLDLSAFDPANRTLTQNGSGDIQIQLDADTFVIVEGYLPAQLTDLLSPSYSSIVL